MNQSEFVQCSAMAAGRLARFRLGDVRTTPSAFERLHALGLEPADLLTRHQVGDWGDVDDADRVKNEDSLREWQRFISSYDIEGERFWVLTTADRSRTWVFAKADRPSSTVFLPGHARPNLPRANPAREGGRGDEYYI